MPATCSTCCRTFSTISLLLAHVRTVHASYPGFKISCSANGCRRNFTSFKAFRNHVYSFHSHGGASSDFSWGEEESNARDISDNDDDLDLNDPPVDESEPSGTDVQRAAVVTLLKMREQHRLPQSVMSGILFEIESLYDVTLSTLKSRVSTTLSGAGVSSEVIRETTRHLDAHSVFRGLESSHRLTKYCKDNLHLVEPVKHVLGTKTKAVGTGNKRRLVEFEETFVIVSIIQTIEMLLNNEMVVHEIFEGHRSKDGVLRDYCDGKAYYEHNLFRHHPDALQILFYYDDVEFTNPLGSHKNKHKQGIFYFMLGNLHPRHRSKYCSVHLAAMCNRNLIKKYSMNAILRPLVEELKKLENGHTFMVRGAPRTIYGALVLVSADNPASSALGGFKESMSALRYCRHCKTTAEEASSQFQERNLVLRNLVDHIQECDTLEQDSSNYAENSVEFGVNFRSVLMDLQYFNLCSGALLPDVMHDLLEGVLQYEGNLVLRHCIDEKGYFTLTNLSKIMDNIELGYMEIDDRPTSITTKVLHSNTNLNLGQKAAQSALLGRLLPFMVGKYIPEDDKNWLNYLALLEIVDLLMAPEIVEDEVAHLSSMILEHHLQFKELYPDSSIIPKMHNMIHMPRLIRLFGPLVRQWTMRYEAKHNYFKKLSQRLGNFINLSWTLSTRHQQWSCYQWLNDKQIGDCSSQFGPEINESVCDLPSELQFETMTDVTSVKYVSVNGQTYKPSCAVVVDIDQSEGDPVFGRVVKVFNVSGRPVLYVRLYETCEYSKHYHAYTVSPTSVNKSLLVSSLHSPFPLHIRKLCTSTVTYTCIVVKHHLLHTI